LELEIDDAPLPAEATELIEAAQIRVDQFMADAAAQLTAFVPSDYATVCRALRAIAAGNLATGRAFCEWGSGFGVVASLATQFDWDASGIEIEAPLVASARRLAEDFDLPVQFVHGSFIPEGAEAIADQATTAGAADFAWITTDVDGAYQELGLEPDDFDLIFAYPWPGEEHVIDSLFERSAADGALLLTYNQYDAIRLCRKVGRR
jgi:hypothetical protein